MEILTITSSRDKGTVEFDERVNKALEEGYILVERDMIPGGSFGSKTYQPAYYAELVRTDEQPQKDATLTTLDALRIVREFCDDHKCDNTCPLIEFCERHMAEGEGPTDWVLPGEASKEGV